MKSELLLGVSVCTAMLRDLQSWCLIPGILAGFNNKCKYKLGF